MKDPEEHSNLAHKQEMQETLVGLRKQFEQARNRARTDGIAENQARL
jgi:hypothetical protein